MAGFITFSGLSSKDFVYINTITTSLAKIKLLQNDASFQPY